ncbi:MAG: hypothetical protein JW731_10500, partial [Bacteroidales bacterium]|nr:hypothetical protein [Bacteroidales bacterium]
SSPLCGPPYAQAGKGRGCVISRSFQYDIPGGYYLPQKLYNVYTEIYIVYTKIYNAYYLIFNVPLEIFNNSYRIYIYYTKSNIIYLCFV